MSPGKPKACETLEAILKTPPDLGADVAGVEAVGTGVAVAEPVADGFGEQAVKITIITSARINAMDIFFIFDLLR